MKTVFGCMFIVIFLISNQGKADFLLGLNGVTEQNLTARISLEEAFAGDLPDQFDWRNYEGRDWMLPVRDQGRCGSCVAFAATSVFSSQWNITSRTMGWSFSPQYLFSCGGGSCVNGWYVDKALTDLSKWGTPDEACAPYLSGIDGRGVGCGACADSARRRRTAFDHYQVGGSIANIKRTLLKGPIISTMKVYEDFYKYSGGIYQHKSGFFVGGHAVVIVGWDDADRVWIVRNSWGEEWGEKGDFRIPWNDESAVGVKTYAVTVKPSGKQLSISGLRDGQRLFEPTQVFLGSSGFIPSQVRVVLSRDDQEMKVFKLESPEFVIDPRELPAGRYLMRAYAQSEDSEVVSHPKVIVISHADLTGVVKFQGSNLDKTMNLDEDIEIRSDFLPILPEKLRFIMKDGSGNIVKDRTTTELGAVTVFHLATRSYQNGRYTIEVHAYESGRLLASDSKTIEIRNRL